MRQAGLEAEWPRAEPRAPRFPLPDLACDTHAHVFGPIDRYPMVPDRTYTPVLPGLDRYLAMHDALGIGRGVLVQPSVYGTDNRAMLDALALHPGRLRGIAVIDGTTATPEMLEGLHEAGVRGVRFNLMFRGGVAIDGLEETARRIAPYGWHIQFLVHGRDLPELAPRVERLPVAVVFDHLAQLDPARDDTPHRALWRLLEGGRTWVKLSGANRVSAEAAGFADTISLGRRIAERAPDRCVWGSDWPHVALKRPMFDTTDHLDLLEHWVPDAAARARMLVENPAELYGF